MRKGDKLYNKWKGYDSSFNSGIDNKDAIYKRSYYPEPDNHVRNKIKVELNLSNYATKTNVKGATGADTSNLPAKSELASLKAEVDKIDMDKLNPAPADLSKLSNVADNDAVKKNCV